MQNREFLFTDFCGRWLTVALYRHLTVVRKKAKNEALRTTALEVQLPNSCTSQVSDSMQVLHFTVFPAGMSVAGRKQSVYYERLSDAISRVHSCWQRRQSFSVHAIPLSGKQNVSFSTYIYDSRPTYPKDNTCDSVDRLTMCTSVIKCILLLTQKINIRLNHRPSPSFNP